jgi:hypothetical protein
LRRHLKSIFLEDSINFTNRVFIIYLLSHKSLGNKSGRSTENINGSANFLLKRLESEKEVWSGRRWPT